MKDALIIEPPKKVHKRSSSRWTGITEYQHYTSKDLDHIKQIRVLSKEQIFQMKVVSQVLPFKVNNYILDELIDWDNIPGDPIFQLTFPQKGMLTDKAFNEVADLLRSDAPKEELRKKVDEIRYSLNPHPAGQMQMNVPKVNGQPLPGVQHKYKETALFFPTSGQTCHAYCTFCFRWAQFVGINELKFASKEAAQLVEYLRQHKEVSDILFTGGDPMVMKTRVFQRYLEPFLESDLDHVQTIRIGTKSVAYWPQRFVTDQDADEFLRLIERLVKSGKHVAFMGHYNHWVELETPVAREAIRRIRSTGAQIRTQSPLIRHINDDPEVWETMWRNQVRYGLIPYYMFVERDTGARNYFEVPLVEAWDIFRNAWKKVSGLGRTVRGPSMSATPGKVEIQGVAEIRGEKVIVLRFIQGRNPDWVERPFFAKYDKKAGWLDQLEPAFSENKFFYEDEMEERMRRTLHDIDIISKENMEVTL
jgi:KamA family protein